MKNFVKFAAVAVVAVGMFTTACKPKAPETPAADSVNTTAPVEAPVTPDTTANKDTTTAPAAGTTAPAGGATTK